MGKMRSLYRNIFQKGRVEHALDDELSAHVQMLVDEKVAAGMDEASAWRQARMELGGMDQVKENVREARMGASIELALQDVRYALRTIRKAPALATVAILTIALGIGANTAVFSVFNSVLLRPLPYPNEQQIVAIFEKRLNENGVRSPISAPDFLDWRKLATTLDSIALYDAKRLNIANGGEADLVPGTHVTAGFFEALRVRPKLGRTFEVADEDAGRQQVAVITHGTWQRRFGGDAAILGKIIHVNGAPTQIVGVLPEGFRYPFAAARELFVPLRFTADQRAFRGIHGFKGIARVRDGVTVEQARAEMEVISRQLEKQNPDSNTGHVATLLPLHEQLAGQLRPALLVLLGAVALVILIACANVANLLLARATVRARETAVRAALGCSRRRLIGQSLTESAVLAFAGAVAGIALAWWGLAALRVAFFSRLDFFATAGLDTIVVDWRVLMFTLSCAIISTLLFGISPALAGTRIDLNEALRTGGRGLTSSGGHKFRSALVVIQVALSLMLLTGAGLLGKSFLRLMSVNPGFKPEGVMTATISVPGSKYPSTDQAARFYDALVERVAALPGVRLAGVTDILPLTGDDNRTGVRIEGSEPRPGERRRMHPRLVSPGYLETMGVRLLEGRTFTAADASGKRHVAIVSEAAARQYWPEVSPVGRRFATTVENAPWMEVIGVVGAVHNLGLDEDATADVYLPVRENPFRYGVTKVTLAIKSSDDDGALASSIRAAVGSIDRSVAVSDIRSMESHIADSTAPEWFNLVLLTLFACIAIVLAAAGLYGTLAYIVSQRTAEIGIRVALGAQRSEVLRVVMGRGFRLALAGIGVGTAASLAATQLMSKLLFGVHPRDPLTFVVIPLLLMAVALTASYIPALRATRLDPVAALRSE